MDLLGFLRRSWEVLEDPLRVLERYLGIFVVLGGPLGVPLGFHPMSVPGGSSEGPRGPCEKSRGNENTEGSLRVSVGSPWGALG